jgi:hypothetical protein
MRSFRLLILAALLLVGAFAATGCVEQHYGCDVNYGCWYVSQVDLLSQPPVNGWVEGALPAPNCVHISWLTGLGWKDSPASCHGARVYFEGPVAAPFELCDSSNNCIVAPDNHRTLN